MEGRSIFEAHYALICYACVILVMTARYLLLCSQEEVFCTSYITAHYLKHILRLRGRAYLMGMPGFARELDMMDVSYTGVGVSGGCLVPLALTFHSTLTSGGPSDWHPFRVASSNSGPRCKVSTYNVPFFIFLPFLCPSGWSCCCWL